MNANSANQNLVVTAFWQVNPGEEAAIAGLLKQFLPQAQQEPGVKEFQIHQNTARPSEFFFYEVFVGECRVRRAPADPAFQGNHRRAGDPETGEARTRAVPVYLDWPSVSRTRCGTQWRSAEPGPSNDASARGALDQPRTTPQVRRTARHPGHASDGACAGHPRLYNLSV